MPEDGGGASLHLPTLKKTPSLIRAYGIPIVFGLYVAENTNMYMMSDTEGSYHSPLIFNDMFNLCAWSLLGSLRVVFCLRVKRAVDQTHCYEKRNSSMCIFLQTKLIFMGKVLHEDLFRQTSAR